MKLKEIKVMTSEELEVKLLDNEKDLFKARFQKNSSPLKNPMIIRTLRRDIARIRTILTEREKENKKKIRA
ncbi:50S ribosomal protein L29 [bacterium]